MRWMVTGATGLLGANAAIDLSAHSDVVGVARHFPAHVGVQFVSADLADSEGRRALIARSASDVVLHCAAVSSIEACERDPELARILNVDTSADLAAQASREGVKFVHISTDAVFDGAAGPYAEDAVTTPTTTYGRTKRDAEIAVLDANPDAIVARVNFYGWSPTGKRSLVEFFFDRLASGRSVPGFTDVRVSTMYAGSLVAQIERLVASDARGLFHVVNDEAISKFDFGVAVANTFGFDATLVRPSSASDHLAIARGANLELRTNKLRSVTGVGTSQEGDLMLLKAGALAGRRAAVSEYQ